MSFSGRALRVNLDTVTTSVFEIPAPLRELYLGGRGLNSGLFYHLVPPDTPARSPDNPLLITPGVLAGTPSYATGGFVVTTRSPVTGGLIHSWAVGDLGAALKRAGYDLIWIVGQATAWLYLVIDNQHAELYPAHDLLGLTTVGTNERLMAEHGAEYRVLTLGPAGELSLPYASLVSEGRYMAEPAGGTGAVMAHKRLRALAIRGTRMVKPAKPKDFLAAFTPVSERIEHDPLATIMRTYGSTYYIDLAQQVGGLTGRNGQDASVAAPDAVLAEAFAQHAPQQPHGCPRCPMPCYADYVGSTLIPRPELEAVGGFGVRCGLTTPGAIIEANRRCFLYGLDPNATAQTIALLMECYQRELTHQYPVRWGDEQMVLECIDAIAGKSGVGGILSLGVAEMSEVYHQSDRFAPVVRRLDMTPLDPRAAQGWALHLATSPIGGDARLAMPWYEWLHTPPPWLQSDDHQHDPQLVEGKAERLVWHERFAAGLDAAGLCRRLGLMGYQVAPKELAAMLSADLGKSISAHDIARLGERIITVERLLALQWYHEEDTLPERWLAVALESGPAAHMLPELETLLVRYYAVHMWDEYGVPTTARLNELSIPEPSTRPWK